MKSYNITLNNLKQSFSLLFLVFFVIELQAQNASNSPYSRFGIGNLQTIQTPRNTAMGGLSVGLTSGLDLSSKNPASYLNLDSSTVVFEVSFQMTYRTFLISNKQITYHFKIITCFLYT